MAGRTHQIRLRGTAIHHPIVGDSVYGNRKLDKKLHKEVRRQMLHTRKLEIPHPDNGMPICFEAPIPQDMTELIQVLRAI